MEFWHDLVFEYNDPGRGNDRANDHGTLSEASAVILLMHLVYGPDYPTNIAKFFQELDKKRPPEKKIPQVLIYPSKISSVLKRMKEDKLVILQKEVSVGAGKRSYYALNPKIIQSPAVDDIYYKTDDGLPLSIPLEHIGKFLNWMDMSQKGNIIKQQEEQVRQKRHERSDEIIEFLIDQAPCYFLFMFLLEIKARKWDARIVHDKKRSLSKHIHSLIDYFDGNIHELLPKFIDFKDVD
jgi:hypothetical protein